VVVVPSAVARPNHTVPTGFSSVPPSGPATPEMDTARVAPDRVRAPWAMAATTGPLTAPWVSSSSAGTPSCDCFIALL